jgi:protein-disulfide isomerase
MRYMSSRRRVVAFVVLMLGAAVSIAAVFQRNAAQNSVMITEKGPLISIATITLNSTDHILGDPTNPVRICMFMDEECLPCRGFYKSFVSYWGKNLSSYSYIVYRHYPLRMMHAKSEIEAEASECVFAQKGNQGFWKYVDLLGVKISPVIETTNALIQDAAVEVGVKVPSFIDCLNGGMMLGRVDSDLNLALRAGIHRVPAVIVSKGKDAHLFEGATIAQVRAAVEQFK